MFVGELRHHLWVLSAVGIYFIRNKPFDLWIADSDSTFDHSKWINEFVCGGDIINTKAHCKSWHRTTNLYGIWVRWLRQMANQWMNE